MFRVINLVSVFLLALVLFGGCAGRDPVPVDAYIDGRQPESFERSLGQSFIKYDPTYASIREFRNVIGFENRLHYRPFSVYGYFHNLLGNRSLFLKMFRFFCLGGFSTVANTCTNA